MTKKKGLLFPVVFMIILTGVLTAILALINGVSQPKIEFNQEIELKQKILAVFDILPEEAEPEEIDTVFDERITEEQYEGQSVYILEENGEPAAYAAPFAGPGLWGSIEGYLGVTADMETVTGIEFIKQDETPGLGGRISEEEYKSQYRDLDISGSSPGEIFISRPADGGNVDAIAGATQTSTFVINMLNEDITEFIKSKGGM